MKSYSLTRRIKILIDILMLTLLIVLMCEHTISGIAHEILGTVIFALFIIHNILNYKWYRLIFHGKWNRRIILSFIIDIFIFLALILTMISGMMISGYLFKGLFTDAKSIGRTMHMVSSMWLFVLLSIHLGLHLNTMLFCIRKNVIFLIVEIAIILYGLTILIFVDKIYEELFSLVYFKNYIEQTFIVDILKKIVMALSISLITFNVRNITIRRKTK